MTDAKRGLAEGSFSYGRWQQLKNGTHSFSDVSVFCRENLNLTGTDRPEQLHALRSSQQLLGTLGIRPVLGRNFMAEEDQPGGRHVALISSRLWQNRFGGDPNILGKPIQLNSEAYMIIGILPPATQILFDQVDIWVSDIKDFEFFTTQQMEAGAGYLTGIARMKSGATQKQAQAELDTLNLQYQASFPQALDAGTGTSIRITPLHERIVRNVRPTLLLLWSAIILVLFVASANVANLFAALATTRRRQIAIRSALGASSWRIIRQLLIEGNLPGLVRCLNGLDCCAICRQVPAEQYMGQLCSFSRHTAGLAGLGPHMRRLRWHRNCYCNVARVPFVAHKSERGSA